MNAYRYALSLGRLNEATQGLLVDATRDLLVGADRRSFRREFDAVSNRVKPGDPDSVLAFMRAWNDAVKSAITTGASKPAIAEISPLIATLRTLLDAMSAEFRNQHEQVRALMSDRDVALERGDTEKVEEIRERLKIAKIRIPEDIGKDVVAAYGRLADAMDSGVESLSPEEMALWEQALTGVGGMIHAVGSEVHQTLETGRKIGEKLPEEAGKTLRTVAIVGGVALSAIGIAYVLTKG